MDIVGHRGAAGEAPENTVAGFIHAIERGVRHVELDVQLSADGKLVVVHDDTLDRTTGVTGKVEAFTAKALAGLDARAFGPIWPRKRDTAVPTLTKVLTKTPQLRSYQLEIKTAPKAAIQQVCEQLQVLFPNRAAAKRVVVTSFDEKLHRQLPAVAPHLCRGLVSEKPDCIERAVALKTQWLMIHHSLCDRAFINRAKKAGLLVSVWTVNNPSDIERLYHLGVESVITDYPSMALPLLSRLERDSKSDT